MSSLGSSSTLALGPPTVQFASAGSIVNESSGTGVVIAQLTGTYEADVIVSFSISASSTASGADYTVPLTLTIPAGQLNSSLVVTLADDATSESNEVLLIEIANTNNVGLGTQLTYALEIEDDDNPFVWTGSAADGNWATASNWKGNTIPGVSDKAIFNSTCIGAPCTVVSNTNVTIGGLVLSKGFTGSVTFNSNFNCGAQDLIVDGGTLSINSTGTKTIQGNFQMNGGTFNLSTTQINVMKNFSLLAGTFNHSFGQVRFAGSSGTNQIVAPNVVFMDVSFNGTWVTYDLGGQALKINGLLTLAQVSGGSINNGTLEARGHLQSTAGYAGSVEFLLNGISLQNVTTTAGSWPTGKWTVNKASGSVSLNGNLSLNGAGQDFEILAGTVDMVGFNFNVSDVLTLNSGTQIVRSGGTLSYGSLTDLGGTINP